LVVAACIGSKPDNGAGGPISRGVDAAQLFVEPDDGSRPVVQFIGSARKSFDLAMYLLSDRDVIAALESAESRGVKIRVMLEEHPYGTGPGNETVESRLRTARILTQWSPANFRLSHDKYAIADEQVALVGTANWTHSAFVSNREYLLVIRGEEEVKQLSALFNADWNRQQGWIDDARLVVSPINSRRDFLALIESSRSTVDVEAEEMQDPDIERSLGETARRGVTVRVILPAPVGGPDSNAAGRSRLASDGVLVRVLRNPYIHAKDIVVDRQEAFVGSENISTASLDLNREVGVLVEDASFVEPLEATFEQDWTAASRF
jgi:cardiolipin synthase